MRTRGCDHPACSDVGEFKAPRNKQIDDTNPLFTQGSTHEQNYFWFCLNHVKLYNAAWDYYEGLSPLEMEAAIRFDGVWNRPSWPLGQAQKMEEAIRGKVNRDFMEDEAASFREPPPGEADAQRQSFIHRKAEIEALQELDLQPPVDFSVVKKRYRLLVKEHHPDLYKDGKDSKAGEEKIKRLNSAFTYLKNLYAAME